MCTGKDDEFCPEEPNELVEAAPEPESELLEKTPLHRRTFLKAAALGSAALAFRAAPSLAHTDTQSPCTAGDIFLSGGQIVNEPCTCTPGGTFDAVAVFTVRNDNNARRLNITLHMGTCATFGGRDFLLRTGTDGLSGSCSIAGLGTTQLMYAFLGNLPCGFTQVCCPGSVIAFQTAKNQQDVENCSAPLTKYPGGQCRRQEICITGFGASLNCSTEGCASGSSDACTVPCGGTLYLLASATGGTAGSNGTYRYVVTAPDGVTTYDSGPGQGGSFCFTITDPQSGTYTLQAFDSQGCVRTDTTTVSVVAIEAPILEAGAADCDGNVTFTVTNCDPSLTYTYESADGTPSPQSGVGLCSATFNFPQDGADHTVTVTASNGDSACDQTDSATVTINTPVTVALGAFVQADCSGAGTITATASGGTGTYTFAWTVNGEAQSETGDTLSLAAQLDGECREVTVTATDDAGCASAPASTSFSQCVVTTAC
jgi:hypothetical protein